MMWGRGNQCKEAGKVLTVQLFNRLFEGVARMPVTSGVGWFVIFSTPPTRTMSYRFDMMAMIPQRSADPDDAHAFSILIAGAGKSPAQLADMGAVWAWCSYASLICPIKAALMSLAGSRSSTLWKAARAASAKSSRA